MRRYLIVLALMCFSIRPAYGQGLSQNNVWTGTNTFNNNVIATVGQNTLNAFAINGVRVFDGNKFATISAACSDLPGGEVDIPVGTVTPTAPITCGSPTYFRGAGINQTILKPTSSLAATLFNTPGTGEGYMWSDMTIDMTNAPTVGVFSWTTLLRPILESVRVIYPPTTGTGTVIFKAGSGETHVRNLIISGAGICVDINGDSGQEDYWDNVVCDSPGTFGYRLLRTTTTDVGGQYLKGFKVTNPQNRTGAVGFLVSSSVANTAQPFYCSICTADNVKGGHAANFTNVNEIFLWADNWFASGAPSTSNFAGLFLSGVTGADIGGSRIASASRDLVFAGADTTIRLHGVRFAGTATNIYAAGATLANIRVEDPIFSTSTPMSAADSSALTNAAPSGLYSNGQQIWVSGSQSSAQTLSICDKDVAAPSPCKYLRVSAGQLQILNNAFAVIAQWQDANGAYDFIESSTPPPTSPGNERCYGDSIAHSLKCSYNNLNFHRVPLVETGTCTMGSGTTCTASIPSGFTGGSCFATNGAGVPIAGTCSLAGTTVTVKTLSTNSNAWNFIVIGTPD